MCLIVTPGSLGHLGAGWSPLLHPHGRWSSPPVSHQGFRVQDRQDCSLHLRTRSLSTCWLWCPLTRELGVETCACSSRSEGALEKGSEPRQIPHHLSEAPGRGRRAVATVVALFGFWLLLCFFHFSSSPLLIPAPALLFVTSPPCLNSLLVSNLWKDALPWLGRCGD